MLLTSIYSGGSQAGGGRSALDNRNTAPGMNQESIGGGNSRGGTGRNGNNNNRRNGSGTRGGSGGGTTVSALQLDPGNGDGNDEGAEVRVVADEENNSLMIYSTGMQYKTIKAAVEKLDVPPTQVLIEASIVEVTLNDAAEVRIGMDV